jgi:DNA-binding beta-propeller fold protein YncE
LQKALGLITAAATIGLMSACSSGSTSTGASVAPTVGVGQDQAYVDVSRLGISPKYLALTRVPSGHPAARPFHEAKIAKDLFVADYGLDAVEILTNKTWQNIGSITTGIDKPDGTFADKKGNLYISNAGTVDITEYKPGKGSPKYTYSAGMENPTDVSVDSRGNVYEADFEGGFVAEYAQGSNTQSEECAITGWVGGVAVDKSGDVFVAFYNKDTDAGQIDEYAGGLSGCNATVLGPSLVFPGGMAIDAKGNLVVCDQDNNTVDIIDPPYSSISSYLGSGYSDPLHVRIGKKDKLAYVDNYNFGDATVWVEDYPSGSVVATLGTSNGLSAPLSAVDGENEVP